MCVLWVAELKYVCMYIHYYVGCVAPEHSNSCVYDICPLAHPPLRENSCRVRLPRRGLVTGGHVSGEEANVEYRHLARQACA